ncbi:MAG: DegT/DnrJ/EryC1/StrS family aminotransferase [Christensenellales bacterium]|jgi:dTDP-4-amino-4,6-dideoxygalactose transaminase
MYRMGKPEVEAVERVLTSHQLFRIGSKFQEVNNFEKEFSEKMGAAHCLCLSSGTGALTAALAALGIGPGDEVIVPAYTFMATAVAVLSVGAIPVVTEIDETMTLDMDDLERKITKNTKCVIPVHIQGFPCNMARLMELKEKYGFYVVEDACQADGGSYRGKRLGTIGDCGAYSFNYFKIISAGEGGAMVTNDIELYQRAIIYHDCGTPFWTYETPITEPLYTGTNMRVSEITGAIMRVQLTRLDGILADLRRVKKTVMDAVADVPGLKANPSHDIEGDCGVCIPFIFDTVEKAERFEKLIGGTRPINTGKHVYREWTPILEKRGAPSRALNPYEDPQNAGLRLDTTVDSCPKTLDILSRTVYQFLHCDWDDQKINEVVKTIRAAAEAL